MEPRDMRRPPGQLEFDATFESGNIGEVMRVSQVDWDIHIRGDTLNPRYRVWFYFAVSNMHAGQKCLFHITNYSKTKSLYREGMTPTVCSSSRPRWERLADRHVFYYRSARHNNEYVLTFAFAFDRAETFYFAYCYPYTYTDLQRLLHVLDGRGLPHYRRECLCRTVQHRRLDLITIGSPQLLAKDIVAASGAPAREGDAPTPVIFLTARVHPGETPASFMMHGLLAFLLSEDAAAAALRARCLLKVVPMLNPDGVFLGNYRCSSVGFDLNRHWQRPSTWSAPTIAAVRRLMARYASNERWAPALALDLHAHSTATNGFLFCNSSDEPAQFERESVFPRALGEVAHDFSFAHSKFCADPAKAGTGRRVMSDLLGGAPCYALEVSFFCARDDAGQISAYTQAGYIELGRKVGLALVRYATDDPARVDRALAPPAQPGHDRAAAAGSGRRLPPFSCAAAALAAGGAGAPSQHDGGSLAAARPLSGAAAPRPTRPSAPPWHTCARRASVPDATSSLGSQAAPGSRGAGASLARDPMLATAAASKRIIRAAEARRASFRAPQRAPSAPPARGRLASMGAPSDAVSITSALSSRTRWQTESHWTTAPTSDDDDDG